jgi:transposase, IS5 family
MQGMDSKNVINSKNRSASKRKYISPNQLTLCGFETPFEQKLTRLNRWVKLAGLIPWDKIVHKYESQFRSVEGRRPINGRVVIGAVIIKHMLSLDDRETIEQIQENMFMQYFLGYESFDNEPPFDASLFVDIRKRLDHNMLDEINHIILAHHFSEYEYGLKREENTEGNQDQDEHSDRLETIDSVKESEPEKIEHENNVTPEGVEELKIEEITHKGKLLLDATVAPQEVTYPTDLKLLNASREKAEEIIDKLYSKLDHGPVKVRTYRELARKHYLSVAKKKNKTRVEIRKAICAQLGYLKRDLQHIKNLKAVLDDEQIDRRLKAKNSTYLETITKVYEQQEWMFTNNTNTIEHRIVNIHQPHVRPIVRGKEGRKVEFGSKLHVALTDGLMFIDKLSWDNFNEGTILKESVERYKSRLGYYPKEVLVDKIYGTRENRDYLKNLKIDINVKPLGRPRKDEALQNHVSPGERNPIEGKFGQAKRGYRMNCIFARLKDTSESWICSIALVLNLVKLMGRASLYLYHTLLIFVSCHFCRNRRLAS